MEEVRHVHLAEPGVPWRPGLPQHRRTSDHHLVYSQGALNEDMYLMIAVLSPDAHEQARDNSIMYNIGREAEIFRQQF